MTVEEFVEAAADGDLTTLDRYLENGGDPNQRSESNNKDYALIKAVRFAQNKANCVKRLLDCEKANPNITSDIDGTPAFIHAIGKQQAAVVDHFLDRDDLDVNIRKDQENKTALMHSVVTNSPQILTNCLSGRTLILTPFKVAIGSLVRIMIKPR